MSEFNPSTCEVTRAILTSYDNSKTADISTNFVGKWTIVQSMSEVSYSGELFIIDTANVLEGFPIRGEERLDLWIKSFDLGTEVKIKGRIHKVTGIIPSPSSNSVSYTLHFVSDTTFNASLRKITAPYRGSINQMAEEIFRQYFSPIGEPDYLDPNDRTKTLPIATKRFPISSGEYDRSLFIQPTVGVAKIIIPDLSPTEAMYLIASRGYNPASPSQTFRFFETIDGFYFCTDEYFLKGQTESSVQKLYYAPVVPLTPENAESQLGRIEEVQILSKGIDTSTDVFSGSYRNEVVELDLIRREFNVSTFNFEDATYIDMDGTTRDLGANPHTEQFRNEVFTQENARRFMLFKNYQRNGDAPSSLQANKHLAEIVHNRVSYFHHLNNTALAVGMKGRLDLKPGMVVNVDMKALRGTGESASNSNDSLSGRYLIQATNHAMDEQGTLNTALRLVKFDWSLGTAQVQSQEIPEDDNG
jgi:hypothetical protein